MKNNTIFFGWVLMAQLLLGYGVFAQTINFATVGNDNNCDFRTGSTRIQDAIDSGLYNEIRIQTGTYRENLILNDIDMRLIGGFANCTDAENNVKAISFLTRSIVSNLSSNRGDLLSIRGDQNQNDVYVEDMRFSTGRQGISVVDAVVDIELFRVSVSNNFLTGEFNDGAGIGIKDGEVSLVGSEVSINSNNSTAANGGGLSCEGSNNEVTFFGTNDISNNRANNNGGGVAIYDSCLMYMEGGIGEISGVRGNIAGNNGGGVYVNNSRFTYESTSDGPARISSNRADNDGGGLYGTGAQASVLLGSGTIEANRAGVDGGGLYVDNEATLNIGYQVRNGLIRPESCFWNEGKCTLITGNESTFGAAVYAETLGYLTVQHAFVENNRGDTGVIGYAFRGGELDVVGSFITANGNGGMIDNGVDRSDRFLFFTNAGGITNDLTRTNISESTIADNNVLEELLISFEGDFEVVASIIGESNANTIYDGSNGRTESFRCLMVHESNSLVNTNNVIVDNPRFVDRSGGDFHLAADSPAIDLCDQFTDISSLLDIDGDLRSFDDPTAANQGGFADAGADESILNDIIFKDGFE